MKIIYLIIIVLFIATTTLNALNGKGTKDDPYQITTIYELQNIKTDNQDIYYILMNDINASETRNWNIGDHDGESSTPAEPMGFKPISRFFGSFDGNGHVIKNLFINLPRQYDVGLFSGFVVPEILINKLGIENCDITGRSLVGSLCGDCEYGIINQCYSTGKVTSTDSTGRFNIGGFCGVNIGCDITECYSLCYVFSNSNDKYTAASFSSYTLGNNFVRYCYSTGKVFCPGGSFVFQTYEDAENCFWDVETTGIPDTGGHRAKGLPTSEMKKKATYVNAGWDLDSVWCIDEGKDYPKLRAFGKCPPTDVPQEPNRIVGILKISPNPTTTTCTISFSQEGLCRKFQVFNCFGADVTRILMNTKINDNNIQLDVSALSGGVYFAMLDLNGRHYSKPFVVLR